MEVWLAIAQTLWTSLATVLMLETLLLHSNYLLFLKMMLKSKQTTAYIMPATAATE